MNDLNTYLYSAYFIESIRDRVSTTHMHVTSKEREAITDINRCNKVRARVRVSRNISSRRAN